MILSGVLLALIFFLLLYIHNVSQDERIGSLEKIAMEMKVSK